MDRRDSLLEIYKMQQALNRKKITNNYANYITYVNPQYQHAKHTLYLCSILDKVESGEIKRLIVTMPPRHSKSETITSFFPGYFYGKHPELDIIIAANSDGLASDFNVKSRDVINEHGEFLWGQKLNKSKKSTKNWGFQGYRSGVKSAGIKTNITGRGFSLGIIDDPISSYEEAMSEEHNKKVWDWYRNIFFTRQAPNSRIIIVSTRWHEHDLIGKILEREPHKWTVINIPAVCYSDSDILGRKYGEYLWPERFDEAFYTDLRENLSSFNWNALYQCNPIPESGNLFSGKNFRIWNDPIKYNKPILSIDATFKGGDKSDYFVAQVWQPFEDNHFMIDICREKLDFNEQIEAILKLYEKWDVGTILIEDKANGSAIISHLKKTHRIPGIVPINPRGSKLERATRIIHYFEGNNIYLTNATYLNGETISEFIKFPNGKHDDIVDATTQYLNWNESKRPKARFINVKGV